MSYKILVLIGAEQHVPDISGCCAVLDELCLTITKVQHGLCLPLKVFGHPIREVGVGCNRFRGCAETKVPKRGGFELQGDVSHPGEIVCPYKLVHLVGPHTDNRTTGVPCAMK
ncbi:hypothetical protein KP509_25G067400 [Ceratopteris richardii]|uniref:Uncharacterized protein n=1 Tax=Ceratopteris richardii TaxID=49495 RepID=A0A8T2RRC0_CERRI|nr:hypothetical protein KP509_25G067400 [Ceratopteris richardii]